jgi:hypothetical protein
MTIGSHTTTHPMLTNESPRRVLAETAESRHELERRLGIAVKHFAYPAGCFDLGVVSAVAAAGYLFGYTTCQHRDRARPLLTIPRRLFWQNSCLDAFGEFSSSLMSCQIKGSFDFGRGCNHAHVDVYHDTPAATEAGTGSMSGASTKESPAGSAAGSSPE